MPALPPPPPPLPPPPPPNSHCISYAIQLVLLLTTCFFILQTIPSNSNKLQLDITLQLGDKNDVCGFIHVLNNWPRNFTTCESHRVITKDGFILQLKRLSHITPARGVVLLLPGIGDSSATFVNSGVNSSLVGILLQHGWETWLMDERGKGPLSHISNQSHDSNELWNFSLQEKADFDIPSAIDLILRVSGRAQLDAFVAHSQGGLLALLSLSEHQSTAAKVKNVVTLASPMTGWSPEVAIPRPILYMLEFMVRFIFGNPARMASWIRHFVARACLFMPWACTIGVCLVAGGCISNYSLTISPDRWPSIFSFYPVPTSLRNLHHLTQMETNQMMAKYDFFDENVNRAMYNGLTKPPSYSLKKLRTPAYVYFGSHDVLVGKRRFDVENLFEMGVMKETKTFDGYGHAHFVWDEKNARDGVYKAIVGILDGTRCSAMQNTPLPPYNPTTTTMQPSMLLFTIFVALITFFSPNIVFGQDGFDTGRWSYITYEYGTKAKPLVQFNPFHVTVYAPIACSSQCGEFTTIGFPVLLFATGFAAQLDQADYTDFLIGTCRQGIVVVVIDETVGLSLTQDYTKLGVYAGKVVTYINDNTATGMLADLRARGVTNTIYMPNNKIFFGGHSSGVHIVLEYINQQGIAEKHCNNVGGVAMISPLDGQDPVGFGGGFIIKDGVGGSTLSFITPAVMVSAELDDVAVHGQVDRQVRSTQRNKETSCVVSFRYWLQRKQNHRICARTTQIQ